jgi:ABC-2 type transport system permease protein
VTTTATLDRAAGPARGYTFRTVAQMEWQKLRSVRSTWFMLAGYAASMVILAVVALSHEGYGQLSAADRAAFDPAHDSFIGLVLGQLLVGTLGVLAITPEFSSGMIRATFAAVPRRPLVLAAKAAVLGGVTLVVGEVSALVAFLVGQAVLPAPAPHAALSEPGVLRAVLMAGAYPALIALVGLGLGAAIRHTAGGICALVGVLFVLPLLVASSSAANYLPHPIANSLTAVKPMAGALPTGVAFTLLWAYAAVVLAAGAWALARRDA